ncbi:MAG: KEOPS complex subunit Pcc1 [Sulfolobaceae archaeon]|nr:KEOPS complex subunit Pcc1 [Sulfolobaceae archaeon]
MILEVKIRVKSNYAREIANSIKVDNINLPKGMQITTDYTNNEIIVNIRYDFDDVKGILTVRNTADEILTQIKTIEETLDNLK